MKEARRSFGMKSAITLVAAAILLPIGGCKQKPAQTVVTTAPPSATLVEPEIGGQKVIVLRRSRTGDGTHPEFLSATLLPGRGMNVFQITAYMPGKGEVSMLTSPSLQDAAKFLDSGPDDLNGNKSFLLGGALLFPFANRIRGPLTRDKKFILATWHGRTVPLVANWHGKKPGAPLVAMHGQMLAAKADAFSTQTTSDGATATATYHLKANGHWFSDNDVTIDASLTADAFTLTLHATNTGGKAEPVGVAWHGYYQLPSGNRANARLHVPAEMRAEVNNYDDVFPTGKLLPVKGTPYDFTAPQGAPLPNVLMDESFLQLQHAANGDTEVDLTDVAANYGVRITALTPLVQTYQVYSPIDKSFVAIEPQFNYNDPFGKEWGKKDTDMVTVEPGKSVTWKASLQLFQPSSQGKAQ
ncbi:MAG TPA: aldose 1-epimerase [Acidobacteriaceae bacterium]|nr:aldose 1-epimerase [Acidobacteriaceae bacterium]